MAEPVYYRHKRRIGMMVVTCRRLVNRFILVQVPSNAKDVVKTENKTLSRVEMALSNPTIEKLLYMGICNSDLDAIGRCGDLRIC